MDVNDKIYVAGHSGMVGSSFLRKLRNLGYKKIIYASRDDLDLTDQKKVNQFFINKKPDYVFIAAAKVGGIKANNTYRAQFLYQNLMIQNNLIHSSYTAGVKKLMFLGSSCIYPKLAPQPIKESYLLNGHLEETNEPYAIAKISGIKMCENYFRQYGSNFISVMPTNLYGPGDNFDLESSHVVPALIRKIHEAKSNDLPSVEIWGTGKPMREFLYVDDLTDACIHLFKRLDATQLYSDNISHVNIGFGVDISIRQLVIEIKNMIGYQGKVFFNENMPDGTMKKLLDITYLKNLQWKPKTTLNLGLKKTYHWYLENYDVK
jgi:GDP-L-fucose synthase